MTDKSLEPTPAKRNGQHSVGHMGSRTTNYERRLPCGCVVVVKDGRLTMRRFVPHKEPAK